jgi:hypothetical protein
MFNFIFQLSSFLVHKFLTNRIHLFLELWTSNSSFSKPNFLIRCFFKIKGTIHKCRLEGHLFKIWWQWTHSFLILWSLSKHLISQVRLPSLTLKPNFWLNSNCYSNNSSSNSILWANNNRCFNSSSSSHSRSHHSPRLPNQGNLTIDPRLTPQIQITSNLPLSLITMAMATISRQLVTTRIIWFRRYLTTFSCKTMELLLT